MADKQFAGEARRPDAGLVEAAVATNSFRLIDTAAGSTGLLTNALRWRAATDLPFGRTAEEFLVNTRLRRNDRETELSVASYLSDAGTVLVSMNGHTAAGGFRRVVLPAAGLPTMSLPDALARRRSVRLFTGDAMHLRSLAAILRAADGVVRRAEARLGDDSRASLALRTAASAGGLYPVDIYVAALNVSALDVGVYRFDPLADVLWQIGGRGEVEHVRQSFVVPDDAISLSRASVVFLLVGQAWRTMRKYGSRGMRYVFLEAGAIAAHIGLAGTSIGFGSVECASVVDDEAHAALHVDGVYRALLHVVVMGSPGQC